MNIRRNRKGFTLLEVLAAMVVFAFGVLALYRLQSATVMSNSFARELNEKNALAEQVLESLLALNYDDPGLNDTDGDGTDKDQNGNGIDDTLEADPTAVGFGLEDTVNHPDGTIPADPLDTTQTAVYWNVAVGYPIESTKTVRVIVTWQDPRRTDSGGAFVTHRIVLNSVKSPK